jgi:hypothetical protein
MTPKLNITSIEFEAIKTSLRDYLRDQTLFRDYDFEGSALTKLIELLAYNTYYTAWYTNMVANEMTLETAAVRDSLLSHAKALNYIPTSRRGPIALIDVTVTPFLGNTQSSLTIDKFHPFESESIDGVNYTFVARESYSINKENGVFPFTDVEIIQGVPQTATFTYDNINNPRAEFELPDNTIDTSTLSILVQTSAVNTTTEIFTVSPDVTGLDVNSAVCFLSSTTDNKYKLVFGDGRISKALSNGNIVIASYLTTDGEAANKANSFATGSINGFSNVSITSISAAAGGAERETDDSIKFNAPLYYSSQNRAVTPSDFAVLLLRNYPNMRSVAVWGGEDNDPPVYDTVFISYILRDGILINEIEKARILREIIKPLNIVTVGAVFVDPDYLYLKFISNVNVNARGTSLNSAQVKDLLRTAILDYVESNLNQFNATYASSKVEGAIDAALPAIIGSDTVTKLEKRITPSLGEPHVYEIFFRTALKRSTVTSGLASTGFYVFDSLNIRRLAFIEEVFNSFTGIDEIQITNPGFGYVEAPTVTIVGDGTGANAVATIVNGRVDSITIVDRGANYTTATVSFSGGGGQSAEASPIIASRFGTLRLYYNKSNAEKETINPEIGLINYETGEIELNNLNVDGVDAEDGQIRFSIEPESAILKSTNNQLMTIDEEDTGAIVLNVNML